jgi:HD-GYP domain-containing protein (c-di-GMP phosphodiesterase class II)
MDAHVTGRTSQPHIAVAVSDRQLRSEIARSLTSFYQFKEYGDMSKTLAGCRTRPPLLLVASEQLPLTGGFDLVRMMRLDPKLAAIPAVMVVANDDKATRDSVRRCGADGVLAPPFDRGSLITKVSGLINRGVENNWQKLQPIQRQALTETLHLFNGISSLISEGRPIRYQAASDACKSLVEVVATDDYKSMLHGIRDHDNYTYSHSLRVATYLALFGHNLRLPKDEQVQLATGGLLHDIGKLSIPYEVLNKPGPLDETELAVMRGHVPATIAYLEGCPDLPKGIITIAAQHHEKVDGTGYPLGLAGDQLNRLARMAAIIDVFTALTDRRSYKPSIEADTALDIMAGQMASHLDIKLLRLFRQMLLDATRDVPQTLAGAA